MIINHSKNIPKLLVIVGMPGSGKSVVVDYFKHKGWHVIYFGKVTINEIKNRNLSINENNEKLIREELRKKYGMDIYAKFLFPKIKKALLMGPTVIDGLYSWAEYKFLKQNLENQMLIIAVFTPRPMRYKRLAQRTYRPLSFREAELRDFAEIEKLEKGGPIAIADYIILNNGSKKNLYSSIDNLLVTIYPT